MATLASSGHRVLRTRLFPVLTSARLTARAGPGYGDHLARHVRLLESTVFRRERVARGGRPAMTE
ncbi:hypothetical protein [Streptomyces sp. NBC_01185]|uniref:hypothetical protein n=1 Tax=Streptomyces sp. NBC_01185 TaxID=2903764 RepID=UPI00386F48D5|nr:hypothetical protein OG770_02685 [Streptomyces sp. NBC_01185]